MRPTLLPLGQMTQYVIGGKYKTPTSTMCDHYSSHDQKETKIIRPCCSMKVCEHKFNQFLPTGPDRLLYSTVCVPHLHFVSSGRLKYVNQVTGGYIKHDMA